MQTIVFQLGFNLNYEKFECQKRKKKLKKMNKRKKKVYIGVKS